MLKCFAALMMIQGIAFAEDLPKPPKLGDEDKGKVSEMGTIAGYSSLVQPKSIKLDFEVEKITLDNGMVFLLHSQRSVPLVSYHTWFRVGAKDELEGESGLAHMFEHMMFKGTPRYPNKDFDRILQANGIVNNAFTNQDYTGYFEILPSSKLELIMDMESDRLQSLNMIDEEFQKEREVVKEERRMRYDNDPGGMGWEKLISNIFNNTKYGLPVIGTMKEINDFNIDKLQKFYKKWYVPSNAVVVIVGDFDPSHMKKLIKKYYEPLKSPPRPQRQSLVGLGNENKIKRKSDRVPFPVQSAEIYLASRTIKAGADDGYALDLMSSILGQGKSSRLFQDLVYRKQMALSAGSGHHSLQDSGIFYLHATAKPGVSAKQMQKNLESELDRFLSQPIREEELIKAKNSVLSDYVESLKTNDGKARILAMNEVLFGDYREFFKDIDRYLKVTINDINRTKAYLAYDNRIQITVDKQEGKK